jgi:4-alpha-glucanotransferase
MTSGWFHTPAGSTSTRTAEEIERERNFCLEYLNTDGRTIQWDFIRAVLASVANTAIVPMQDVLGLGSEARMNLPNTTEGNWMWRLKPDALTAELAAKLQKLTELYGRIPESEDAEARLDN